MAQLFSNNGSTTTIAGISDNDTTILVTGGTGELFPLLNNGDPDEFSMCTLEDQFGNYEIVKATGRVGDNFTVERGAEGTTPQAFSTGTRFELRMTKGSLEGFIQKVGDIIDGGTY